MNGKLASPQAGILLIAAAAAIGATFLGLIFTGGFSAFAAAFRAGQGVQLVLTLLGLLGAGIALIYVVAALLLGRNVPEAADEMDER